MIVLPWQPPERVWTFIKHHVMSLEFSVTLVCVRACILVSVIHFLLITSLSVILNHEKCVGCGGEGGHFLAYSGEGKSQEVIGEEMPLRGDVS